jgi:hypothetical protein
MSSSSSFSRRIGKYNISTMCLETFPCQHFVENTETGETYRINGGEIFKMLRDDGLSDNHFNMYKEHVRKQEFPTLEEIRSREKWARRLDEATAQRNEEKRHQQGVVNQYKASSYTERLKTRAMN